MPKSRSRKASRPDGTERPVAKRPPGFVDPAPLGQPVISGRPVVTSRVNYIVVSDFLPGHPQRELSNGPVGSSGQYEAIFVLAVPGVNIVQEHSNFPKMMAAGDSLLEVREDVAELTVTAATPRSRDELSSIKIGINGSHRISSLALELEAETFKDAAGRAHDVIMPILSRWSFLHDIAIAVSVVQIRELSTNKRSWTHLLRGAVKAFSDSGGSTTAEVRCLLAAYREGISSTEPLYQALSLFKVAEGVYKLRGQRMDTELTTGNSYREPGERIPEQVVAPTSTRSEADLVDALRPYAGKKFTQVRDDFKVILRNAIAHLNPDADPLTPDNYADLERVHQALPVLKYMSRILLASELPENWLT